VGAHQLELMSRPDDREIAITTYFRKTDVLKLTSLAISRQEIQ
jgi:hypothetical protein